MSSVFATLAAFCAAEEKVAVDLHVRRGAPSLKWVPGAARCFVAGSLVLELMDWAWRARIWEPAGTSVCCVARGGPEIFAPDVAEAVVLGMLRHFCERQETEIEAVVGTTARARAQSAGRHLVASPRYLPLLDAALAAGVWAPVGELLLPETAA